MYSDIEINENGVITKVPVTNDWILTNKPPHLLLALNVASITGNGIDSATLTAQLVTAPLLDGTQEPVLQSKMVTVQIGDVTQEITLDANGAWSDSIVSVLVGSYLIEAIDTPSNQVMLEVI